MNQRIKYSFLISLRNRELLISLICTTVLTTFFIFLWGHQREEDPSEQAPIPVAVVSENVDFLNWLEQDSRLMVYPLNLETAMEKLETGTVAGILELGDQLRLHLTQNERPQLLLERIAEQYLSGLMDIPPFPSHNEPMELGEEAILFYSLFTLFMLAIAALSGIFQSFKLAIRLQPHLEPAGNRRLMGAIPTFSLMLADIVGASLFYFLVSIANLLYFVFILGVDLYFSPILLVPPLLLLSLFGSAMGAFCAFIIPGTTKTKENTLMTTIFIASGAVGAFSVGEAWVSNIVALNYYHLMGFLLLGTALFIGLSRLAMRRDRHVNL